MFLACSLPGSGGWSAASRVIRAITSGTRPCRMSVAWAVTQSSMAGSRGGWKHQAAFHRYSSTWMKSITMARVMPRAENRWYTCDITASRDVTVGKIFDQADRRDPGRLRTWIALVDGDIYQLGLFQAQAAARGITLAILVDFIHVLEYLWKAAWCFHAPATRRWKTG